MKAHIHRTGAHWTITAELHDVSKTPALMVRIKAVRGETGDLIVPALYDDNYNALMPGEERTLHIELENAATREEGPTSSSRIQPQQRRSPAKSGPPPDRADPLCRIASPYSTSTVVLSGRSADESPIIRLTGSVSTRKWPNF